MSSIVNKYAIRVTGNPGAAWDIVFAHGFGCSQEMWLPLLPYFERDYRIILYDHVGSGKSDTSQYSQQRYASLLQYGYDLIEICETLQLRSPVFIGHSVGATIGALASIRRPDLFSNLILIAASPCYLNKDDYNGGFARETIENLITLLQNNFRAWADVITPVIMRNEDRPELETALNESFCATDPDIAKHFARVTFLSDHRIDMKSVTTDTLLLQCTDDSIAPLAVGRFLCDTIVNSVLVTLPASGHCPHISHPMETGGMPYKIIYWKKVVYKEVSQPLQIDLANLAPCGLVYTDATGSILEVNKAFTRMVEAFVVPTQGSRFQNYLSAGSKLLFELHHVPMLALQGFASELMYDLQIGPSKTIPVCITSKLHVSAGVLKFYCHAIFERSHSSQQEKKLLQQKTEADQVLQKRTAFMSMASHEIKNPLQLMQTASDLLNQTQVSEEQKEYIEVLNASADALLKVTTDIMQIGKFDDGHVELMPAPTNLHTMLASLSTSFMLKASAKKLRLEVSIDPNIPDIVLADEAKVQIVLTNLLSNAIKYTTEGSVLLSAKMVRLSDVSVSVAFKVQDTGIGIPADKLHSIFIPFNQLDERASGFGLGLGIAQRIVRLLGSPIHVDTGPTGSTFWFTVTFELPKDKMEETPQQHTAITATGARVLLAEDNELNSQLIGKMLTVSSHAVEKVDSGRLAWELINAGKFDVVLADIQMPDMDGLELLKSIRSSSNHDIRNLPVIIISGEPPTDHLDFITEYRPTDWLVKPFRMQDLLAKLAFLKNELPQTNQEMFPKIRSLCNDHDQYKQVLQKTLEMLKGDEHAVSEAVRQGDNASLKKAIHKLSSSLSYLEASVLHGALAELPATMLHHGSNGVATVSAMHKVQRHFTLLKQSIGRALTQHH